MVQSSVTNLQNRWVKKSIVSSCQGLYSHNDPLPLHPLPLRLRLSVRKSREIISWKREGISIRVINFVRNTLWKFKPGIIICRKPLVYWAKPRAKPPDKNPRWRFKHHSVSICSILIMYLPQPAEICDIKIMSGGNISSFSLPLVHNFAQLAYHHVLAIKHSQPKLHT